MIRNLSVTLLLLSFISSLCLGFAPKNKAALNHAVSQYHQGNYALALSEFDSLKNEANATHRDSITLFQYLGMASTQAGWDSKAVHYFTVLIQIDSLFQFPRNEDARILQNFSLASQTQPNPEKPPIAEAPPISGTPLMGETATAPAAGAAPNPTTLRVLPQTLEPQPAPQQTPNIFATNTNKIGFAYGAIPLGGGWMMQNKNLKGWTLGLLQVTSIALSIYASEIQSDLQNDSDAIHNNSEKTTLKQWQWTQRISLTTALGTYLYSIFSALGD